MNHEEAFDKILAKLECLEGNCKVLASNQDEIRQTQMLIKGSLIGNEFGQTGLVKEFQDHVAVDLIAFKEIKEEQEKNRLLMAKIGGGLAVLGVLVSIGSKVLELAFHR